MTSVCRNTEYLRSHLDQLVLGTLTFDCKTIVASLSLSAFISVAGIGSSRWSAKD